MYISSHLSDDYSVEWSDLRGARILIVEDASLVAMEAQIVFEELGMTVIGPAGRLDQAQELAKNGDIDIAILDIDLNGQHVWPVAEILTQRHIPFAFATGFESATIMPELYAGSPMLAKPYSELGLLKIGRELLKRVVTNGVPKTNSQAD